MKYLIVVDMQVDFINGSLGSKDAESIVNNVVEKVKNFKGKIIFISVCPFSWNKTERNPSATSSPPLYIVKKI